MSAEPNPLQGLRLLLVEDEAMVAMMVEDMLSDLGCVVVDVAGTVSRGLAVADDADLRIDGAVLDVNLGGEAVYPVAEALMAKGVPFIFSTGYNRAGITDRFASIPVLAKPYQSAALARQLVLAMRPGSESPPPGGSAAS